jgi:hypothetical protein
MPTTYLGWTVITMPSTPAAPRSFEASQTDIVAISVSPFTGQQQTQAWSGKYMELSVSLPAMAWVTAQAWVQFLRDLQGMKNVFKFNDAFRAAYPNDLNNADTSARYWRLKDNTRKWSVSDARVYGIQFDVREAL